MLLIMWFKNTGTNEINQIIGKEFSLEYADENH